MPPGWIKAVNSRILMDSFATIDKVLNEGEKKPKSKKCEACCKYFAKKEELSKMKTEIIIDALENINCKEFSQEQMAKILIGMRNFLQTGNINQDLKLINKEDRYWSALSSSEFCYSPHLLHFSRSDIIGMCSPSVRTMESFPYITFYFLSILHAGIRQ